jgi:hypothetical protein
MAFASGSNCSLEEALCIQFQRNTASQRFSGKLPFHLWVEFDSDGHGNLASLPIIGWLRAKVDLKHCGLGLFTSKEAA